MQELVALIAILSLVVVLIVAIMKTLLEMKGDGVMSNMKKRFSYMNLEMLYTISANLVGGALLAKALRLSRYFY